jgi:hypothetical protein
MEHKEHHKREAIFLMSLLVVFGVLFALGIINLKKGISLFGIIPDSAIENWIVVALSFASIVRIFIEIKSA